MENSKTSMSKSNPPTTKEEELGDEESSWTSYFEDFLCNNNEHNSSFSSGYESPSLVSDAASSCSVAKKFVEKTSKKSLSFKKRKTTKVGALVDIDHDHHDHALEDTASSPVNSSKVR
ncbi:hypothetical protein Vadar_008610 [Vaccinium darrowii]|uniref:Uncharacterized protein n=1 Tax=Vaccinium darrowii TaxID=229202 RepID=A0ACB7Z529_9ERIC|nr:hypothetical protein Vadar_008610 [Vaccinium darrowii]